MMMVLDFLVFAAAFGVACAVIAATVAPEWGRILKVAFGDSAGFQPLRQLAHAERRIAVRRWSAGSARIAERRLRAVA